MSDSVETSEGRCRYLNLEVSEKGLSEFHNSSRAVFIPKDQVEAVAVEVGPRAERPLIQLVAGLALLAVGIAGLWMALAGGIRGIYWGVGLATFGAIGLFCLYEAVRKGHYLRVTCTKETRKLVFRGVIDQAELSNFIRSASALGYRFSETSS